MTKIKKEVRALKSTFLTDQGLESLKKELDFLKNVKRFEIASRIEQALEFDDSVENSEYQAAMDEMALVEEQTIRLEAALRGVKLIKHEEKETIELGSLVRVNIDGEVNEFTIVGKLEANPLQKKISDESPLGRALLGARVGSVVDVNAPTLNYKCKVIKVR